MPQLPPAINGTEQRLDVVIDALRALRADVETLTQSQAHPEPAATDEVVLQGRKGSGRASAIGSGAGRHREVVLQEPKKPAKKKRS